MNKSKKTIISIISALFICFLVVLGLVLFTNKTTTTTISKNTKQVKIEIWPTYIKNGRIPGLRNNDFYSLFYH